MESSFQSKSDFGSESVMFNSVALGLNKCKTNQLVLSGCVSNGRSFSRAFVLSHDPGDNAGSVR